MDQKSTTNYQGQLNYSLPIGFDFNGEFLKDIELLKTNGIAEKIFLKKSPEKPYTWIANVLSAAIGRIGQVNVGDVVRAEYLKSETVNIPAVIMRMPLADANTSLVEIHRRVWHNLIRGQEVICKYCTRGLRADIDLSRIEMTEENQKLLEQMTDKMEMIVCELPQGFILNAWLKDIKKETELDSLKDVKFNRIIMRLPTLRDCIKNEKYSTDSLNFWRRISFDCITNIQSITAEGKVLAEVPHEYMLTLGTKLFDKYMEAEDLRAVRTAIREEAPTLGFSYKDVCPCDRAKEIPYAMEASSFFSE